MGLGNNSSKTFLGIREGKIVQRVPEGTKGALSRDLTSGKTVHELHFDYVQGILTGIRKRVTQYNGKDIESWQLDLQSGENTFSLEIGYDSGYATTLLNALANPEVDFSLPMKLSPWSKVVNDKRKVCLYVNQSGRDIKWHFTKENPNGLPEPEKKIFKGKEVWDWYERNQFFEKLVAEQIVPQLPSEDLAAISSTSNYSKTAEDGPFEGKSMEMADTPPSGMGEDEDEDDGLPF